MAEDMCNADHAVRLERSILSYGGETSRFVAYATGNFNDCEAYEALDGLGIDIGEDPRGLSDRRRRPFDRDRLEVLVRRLRGRYFLSSYERLVVSARRLAFILSFRDPASCEPVSHFLDRQKHLEGVITEELRRRSQSWDIGTICAALCTFTQTLRLSDLHVVLPELDIEDSALLNAWMSGNLVAFGEAVSIWGAPNGVWREAELARSLDDHVRFWRKSHDRIVISTSDGEAASLLQKRVGIKATSSHTKFEGVASRIVALLAELAADLAGADEGPSPLAEELRHHHARSSA